MAVTDQRDGWFLATCPIQLDSQMGTLTLSSSSATYPTSGTLPQGWYIARLALSTSTDLAFGSWSATATVPSSGAALAAGFALADGEMLFSDGSTALSVILTGTATGKLALTKVK